MRALRKATIHQRELAGCFHAAEASTDRSPRAAQKSSNRPAERSGALGVNSIQRSLAGAIAPDKPNPVAVAKLKTDVAQRVDDGNVPALVRALVCAVLMAAGGG